MVCGLTGVCVMPKTLVHSLVTEYGGIVGTMGDTNVCMQIEYDDSKWYGYIYGVQGSADPEYTNDGQLFYSFIWDADGNFAMQFGDDGDEQITDTMSFNVYSPYYDGSRIAQWNTDTLRYEFDDIAVATDLINRYNGGITKACIFVSIEEGTALYYNYDTILTGTA